MTHDTYRLSNADTDYNFRGLSPCGDETLEVSVSVGEGGHWRYRLETTVNGVKQALHLNRDAYHKLVMEMVRRL